MSPESVALVLVQWRRLQYLLVPQDTTKSTRMKSRITLPDLHIFARYWQKGNHQNYKGCHVLFSIGASSCEPALPRRRKHPELAYRTHDFLLSLDGSGTEHLLEKAVVYDRARSEERWSHSRQKTSRRSKSEGPPTGQTSYRLLYNKGRDDCDGRSDNEKVLTLVTDTTDFVVQQTTVRRFTGNTVVPQATLSKYTYLSNVKICSVCNYCNKGFKYEHISFLCMHELMLHSGVSGKAPNPLFNASLERARDAQEGTGLELWSFFQPLL